MTALVIDCSEHRLFCTFTYLYRSEFKHREPKEGAKKLNMQIENDLATAVIGAAITVDKAPGPGLVESAYKECLFYEIIKKGIHVEKEKSLPLIYGEIKLECGYRLDLFVENKLVVEIKAIDALNEVHTAQVLTYLKVSGCKLGLLINFNVVKVKDGIRRIIKT